MPAAAARWTLVHTCSKEPCIQSKTCCTRLSLPCNQINSSPKFDNTCKAFQLRFAAAPNIHWQTTYSLKPRYVNDHKLVPKLARKPFGKLFADKGYISKTLRKELLCTFNIQLVTGVRSNMKNAFMRLMDKLLLGKRAIVEVIIDQLKNIFQIQAFCAIEVCLISRSISFAD